MLVFGLRDANDVLKIGGTQSDLSSKAFWNADPYFAVAEQITHIDVIGTIDSQLLLYLRNADLPGRRITRTFLPPAGLHVWSYGQTAQRPRRDETASAYIKQPQTKKNYDFANIVDQIAARESSFRRVRQASDNAAAVFASVTDTGQAREMSSPRCYISLQDGV